MTTRTSHFTVTLKRVVLCEVTIEAETAQQAREQVAADGAHEVMLTSDCIASDITTVAAVKRKDHKGE
jgi:hypothetical protein